MSPTSRFALALAVTAVVLIAMSYPVAAKGGISYMVGASISGGGLPATVSTRISIPDSGYAMRALHAPANGLFANPFELFVLHQTPMPYELVLHYDYERYGGKQDRAALYDGNRLIYFPGPGTWYEASPRLANALREEIRWGLAPADAQGLRGTSIDRYTPEILLVLAGLALLAVGQRIWRSGDDPASAVEVEARMRLRVEPHAFRHL